MDAPCLGGRVELVLRKQGYVCSRDTVVPTAQVIPTLPSSDIQEPPSELSQLPQEPEADPSDPVACKEPALLISCKATSVQRPASIPLPSNRIFTTDDISQFPTAREGSPHSIIFDQSHGSPSSFPVTKVEPCLPILVVDDDPLTRTLMKRILTRLGCIVTCAENGEVALEMILGHDWQVMTGTAPSSDDKPSVEQENQMPDGSKYAVVFLDNQMPIMSGLRVVERLRALGRTDFIVGVTGWFYRSSVLSCLRLITHNRECFAFW